MDDVAENRDNIAANSGNIADNAENLQEYFEDTMNFNAIALIENVRLEAPADTGTPDSPWPVIVEINGNSGYTCDTDDNVDLHTADKLCQKAGYAGALRYFTLGEHFKLDISINISIKYIKAPNTPDNKPLTVGDMHCPSTATTLPECYSSGWGHLQNDCDYDDVLWLTCYRAV